MAGISVTGQIKVFTLQQQFLKEFGLVLRVYDGRALADSDKTLAQTRKHKGTGTGFSVAKNMKVGNLEQKFVVEYGLKVQVAGSDDSYLCSNDLTLNAAQLIDIKKLGRKSAKEARQEDKGSDVGGVEAGIESAIIEDSIQVQRDGPIALNDNKKKMYLVQCSYDDETEDEKLLPLIAKTIADLCKTIKSKIDEPTPIYLFIGSGEEEFCAWPQTVLEILSEDDGVDYINTLEPASKDPSGFTSLVLSKIKPDYADYLLLRIEEWGYDVAVAFHASETKCGELWSDNFDQIGNISSAGGNLMGIKIIGAHSHHNGEYAVQHWSDGSSYEGVDSDPDDQEDYLGLKGDDLKYDGLTEENFDITKYTVIKS